MIGSFDPFVDRPARDIRNSLSKAFVGCLAGEMTSSEVFECIESWLKLNIAPWHQSYLEERRQCFSKVFEVIRSSGVNDPLQQSIVIWNLKLYFEFHEHVEGLWRDTKKRNRRQALKGLIMAAGAYEHLAYRRSRSARRLAERAADLLSRYGKAISFYKNLDELIVALQRGDAVAPLLVPS